MKKSLSIKESKKAAGGSLTVEDERYLDNKYNPSIDKAAKRKDWAEVERLLNEKANERLRIFHSK